MVSVIIPIVKDDPFVDKCVRSIRKSVYDDGIEIIVVDEGLERSKQRNIGVARSKGEYLLILDSDMYINEHLIAECVLLMGWYDALYVPEMILGQSFWCRARNFERSFYDGTRIDAARFFMRSVWQDYDETLSGTEDWDHDRRIDVRKAVTEGCLYHDEQDFSFRKYFRKKRYYAGWADEYARRYPNSPELNFAYRYFGAFVEGGKWKKIVRHPILFAGAYILKITVGVAYLCRKR